MGDGRITIGQFFCGSLTSMDVHWSGSSITAVAAATGYRSLTNVWTLANHIRYAWTYASHAVASRNTWYALNYLTANIITPGAELVIHDQANDGAGNLDNAVSEAFIRKILANLPGCKIVVPLFFAVADQTIDDNVNHATNQAAIDMWITLLTAYSIPYVDFRVAVKDQIDNHGGHLSDYLADTIHPTDAGNALAASLVEAVLTASFLASTQAMPARINAESALYENNAPQELAGSAYDSKTGTWTEAGAVLSSNEVGATITYSGTFQSIGCYNADGVYPNIDLSIDGGAYIADTAFYPNGFRLSGTRQARTVTIKVIAGTVKIEKLMAI